jgi:hypothetical protein
MNGTANDTNGSSSSTYPATKHPRPCTDDEWPTPGGCVIPERIVMVDGYSVAVCGYVIPVAVAMTVVTNGLVCIVLLRKTMRSPTNLLLVAMAVSDMMTGVSTMPAYLHFYTLGAYVDYIPYKWSAL